MHTDNSKEEATTLAVGGTGVAPVKFGVAPNFVVCGGLPFDEQRGAAIHLPTVSGATPETTGETPVPPARYSMLEVQIYFCGYRQTQSPWLMSTTTPPLVNTTTPPSSFPFQPTE